MRKLALLIFVFACYVIVNDPAHVFSYAHTQSHSDFSYSASAQSMSCTPPAGKIFNPCADLDTSQIDYDVPREIAVPTILPDGAGSGAVCGTDAQCADYSRSIGEEPSGYAQGK
jgi:hypothetical protein